MTKKRCACYCSGNASTLLKFYETHSFYDFPLEFVFYDGTSDRSIEKLQDIDPRVRLIHYKNPNGLIGKLLSQEVSDQILINLNEYNIDYMFCFGSKILKPPLIDKYENRIINFHPSLLPAFPGLNAIDQALGHGVKFLGNTAHFVDKGIDTGKIISQSVIHIDDYNSYDDVFHLQINMLKDIWENLGEIDY